MDLHRLAVFAKVYELRSLSRSAEAIYLSQPTVSGHLKKLEEELGVRLFDRLGRGVAPTKAAETLYEYAGRLLALRDEAVQAVAEVDGQVRGNLKVGASTIPGHYLLPGYLTQINSLHPELSISLLLGDTTSVGAMVERGEVEFGVVGARLQNGNLKQRVCCRDQLVLAVNPALHPPGGAISPQELKRLPFLLRESGSGTRMAMAKSLGDLGVRLTDLNVVAEMGSTEAIRQGILAGLGGSLLSRLAVEDDFAVGRLAEIEVEGLNLERSFYLITRLGRSITPGGRRLMGLILEEEEEDD